MPFCSNCGRQLAENEVCNCQANQNTNAVPPPQPNVNNAVPPQQNVNNVPPPPFKNNVNVPPGFQQFDQYGRPLFTPQGQPISYDANGNAIIGGQKKGSGGVIAVVIVVILIVVLFVGGILAAILVPSMLGYVKKSKTASINNDAKTISHAVDSALSDMDYNGYDVSGTYIICSNSSNNRALNTYGAYGSGFDTSTLYRSVENYFSGINEYDWFVVIEYGTVTYCATERKSESGYIGTYPHPADIRQGPAKYNGAYAGSNADLEDLYTSVVWIEAQ